MKPDFVIIGAQKSASTLLHHCLQDHPDVFLPHGETPYFEDPDYKDTKASEFQAIFEGQRECRHGIKRPSYIGKPEVPKRIACDFPSAKLIAILRNPIDRAVSAYFHMINYGFLPPDGVESGLRHVLDDSTWRLQYPRCPEILEFGLYGKYLKLYRHFFERGSIFVLLHDDLVKSPLKVVQSVYRFLDVDDAFHPPSLESRPQKVIYDTRRLKFITARNRFLFSYNNNRTRLTRKHLNAHEWLGAAAITAVDRFILSLFLNNGKPILSNELREQLRAYYRDDIIELQSIIGRDLTAWLK